MIQEFTLKNGNIEAHIINFGARISQLLVPSINGTKINVVTGYDKSEKFINGDPYYGAICGRYANRISKGHFSIGTSQYTLPTNNGPNSLHGGVSGFNNKFWQHITSAPDSVTLRYISKDGEEGFPGDLIVDVKYSISSQNELIIEYSATTNKPTLCNLTSHGFYNLNGQGMPIKNHILQVNADLYTPVDSTLIPTGEILSVKGTPFDFITCHDLDSSLAMKHPQLEFGKCIDHNFVLTKPSKALCHAATLSCKETGISMEVLCTQPGLQIYTGTNTAICLEAQGFPDSPNKGHFPSTLLGIGEKYQEKCIYKFSIIGK